VFCLIDVVFFFALCKDFPLYGFFLLFYDLFGFDCRLMMCLFPFSLLFFVFCFVFLEFRALCYVHFLHTDLLRTTAVEGRVNSPSPYRRAQRVWRHYPIATLRFVLPLFRSTCGGRWTGHFHRTPAC